MNSLITIGMLSKISGVSTRTIRHYEDIGLFQCTSVTDSNYRLYGEREIKKLEQILLFKSLGLSLNDIKVILLTKNNDTVVDIFTNRLQELERKISEINQYKDTLTAITNIYKTRGLNYIDNYHLIKEIVGMNNGFAKIFNKLELRLQIKIIKELYQTGNITSETLREIGSDSGQLFLKELHLSLISQLVNKTDAEVEKSIMMSLEKEAPELSDELKKAMFTFDDCKFLPDETLKKWLLKCSNEDLVIALSESGKFLRNKLYTNMPLERAEIIKNRAANLDSVPLEEVYLAMNNLIDNLRTMDFNGDLELERFQ